MGALSRRKGAANEREAARKLSAAGIPAQRNIEECRTGNVSGDLTLPPSLPVVIQCRCGASPSPWKAIADARAACGPGDIPVALVKRNRAPGRPMEEVAILPVDAFARMLAAAWKAGALGFRTSGPEGGS